jgi:spermidine synthase
MIVMRHGRTLHGLSIDEPGRRTEPTAYYSPDGPFGDVLEWVGERVDSARVGIVGLGTGTAACHARPGQTWDYYEINPTVIRFASDTTYFRFLSECTPGARMWTGDARLRLAEAPGGHFDLLVLDAFNSDAVPVHLITLEAFELYRGRLTADGVLLINISNKWLNLEPVVARHAERLGASAWIRRDVLSSTPERYSSVWMVLTRNLDAVEALREAQWQEARPRPGFRGWTDDYSNVLSVLGLLEREPAGD